MVDESGTKLDKIVISCEMMHLPASMIDLYEESLKQQRFLKSFFADNAVEDELWECYLMHALSSIQGEQLMIAHSDRELGLMESSSAIVSRLINEAVVKRID